MIQAKKTSQYQLIAYRKERIDALCLLLKNNKLTPRSIDLDALALVNLFEVSYPEKVQQPAVIIHAESTSARLLLTESARLVDYEQISYDPEPDPQTLCDHIMQVLPHLGNDPGNPVEIGKTPFFATGALFSQQGFLDTTASILQGLSLLHPFKSIECRIGIDEGKLATYLPQLSVAVGLAIRGDS